MAQQWEKAHAKKYHTTTATSGGLLWYSAYLVETNEVGHPIWEIMIHTAASVAYTNVSATIATIRIEGELPSLQKCKRKLMREIKNQMFGKPKL